MIEDIQRARNGDRDALGRLLEKQQKRLQGLVQKRIQGLLQDKERVSDLLQSGYLQVVRKLPTFRGGTEEEFAAWVVRVLENRIKERRRFHAALKRTPGELPVDDGDVETPSDEMCRLENVQILAEALDALPNDYQTVLTLRVVDDKSHREIAEAMQREEGAVRMLFVRAKAALALEIEKRDR